MDKKTLHSISQNYYEDDTTRFKQVLKPYLEKKFSKLGEEAAKGNTRHVIYLISDDIFDCGWCCFSSSKLDIENYASIQRYFPSLDMNKLIEIVEDVAKEINREHNYGLEIYGIHQCNYAKVIVNWK